MNQKLKLDLIFVLKIMLWNESKLDLIFLEPMLPAATSLRSATNVARSDELFNDLADRATWVAERSEVAAGNIGNQKLDLIFVLKIIFYEMNQKSWIKYLC